MIQNPLRFYIGWSFRGAWSIIPWKCNQNILQQEKPFFLMSHPFDKSGLMAYILYMWLGDMSMIPVKST